jgi:serine/threonine protein kinase
VSDETTPAPADVGPGDKIAGYRLEEQIGQGGMAVVYRAHDERLDRRVALKVLAPGLASDTAFRARFIRESRAAAAVDHPNVIPVYDAGDAGGCLFISMRYVQGGDVRSLLTDGQPLPPARAWNIITQVADALDAAHEHDLIHRDVKPANMLLDRSGSGMPKVKNSADPSKEHVYLSDFGISKQKVASNLTSTGQFVGTLDYIAPEQIEGQSIDGRADQYSLACAAFELLCGAPPFDRPNAFALISSHLSEQPPSLTTLRPELPAAVNRVLGRAMNKAPGLRYPTCGQFAAHLGRALGLVPSPLDAASGPPAGSANETADHAAAWQATELAQRIPAATAQPASEPTRTPAGAPTAAAGASDPDTETVLAAHQVSPGPAPAQRPGGPWQSAQPGGYGPYVPYRTYPDPGAPGGPAWPQQPPRQPPRRSRGMIVGIVAGGLGLAAAAAAIAVIALRPGDSSSTDTSSSSSAASSSPAATARSQAAAVNHLLMISEQSRSRWNSSVLVSNVRQCINIASDVSQIQQIADQRSRESRQATALHTNLIPNGGTLKSQLMTALRISLTIDNDYLKWAKQQQDSGCSVGTNSSYYDQATALNTKATDDKQMFVDTWNPIATRYGLTQFEAGDI